MAWVWKVMCSEMLHVYFCSDSPRENAHHGGSGGFPSEGMSVLSLSHSQRLEMLIPDGHREYTNWMKAELNLSTGIRSASTKTSSASQFYCLLDTDILAKNQKGKSFTNGFAYCEVLTKLSLSHSIKPGPGNNF